MDDFRIVRLLAALFGIYPKASIASWTFLSASSLTFGFFVNTLDTVEVDTPEYLEISLIVTLIPKSPF